MAAASVVAVSALTAGPAIAAPATLTQASCEAGGGTFTLAKGLKTCTTLSETPFSDVVSEGQWDQTGLWLAKYDVQEEGVVTIATVQTQRGRGPIKTRTDFVGATGTRTVIPDSRTCTENVNGVEEPRPVADCEALGLYDLTY